MSFARIPIYNGIDINNYFGVNITSIMFIKI